MKEEEAEEDEKISALGDFRQLPLFLLLNFFIFTDFLQSTVICNRD